MNFQIMQEIKISIKPLSVNEAWKGQRFKTDAYKRYERAMLFLLPRIKMPEPPFEMYYEYGFSNSLSDYDNPTKMVQDILQKKYKFNDNDIYLATIRKVVVPKGKEYVKFRIEHFDGDTRL